MPVVVTGLIVGRRRRIGLPSNRSTDDAESTGSDHDGAAIAVANGVYGRRIPLVAR